MPKYRVTLRRTSVENVDADNPYQAPVVASGRHGDGIEITHVAPSVGRPVGALTGPRKGAAKKAVKTAVKKKRTMSPEARAQLAKNLVKARAARARNLKAAKKATKNTAAKKTVKRSPAKKAVKSR
jgi:hypothetical protein